MTILGVISDTHGLVRPEALAGCDRVLHVGDAASPAVLEALERIAPVVPVRGNTDDGLWAEPLPETARVEAGRARIYVLHRLDDLDFDPAARGIHAVVSGHSHQPRIEDRSGVLYVNPGGAGPRRFDLPLSVARLFVAGSGPRAEIVPIEPA